MENTLLYSTKDHNGLTQFAEMIYHLQTEAVKFEVSQDREWLQITIISGDKC